MIYLVRHGQTVFNAARRIQGLLDSGLTDLGKDQARRVGLAFRDLVRDGRDWRMIVSPLGRCRATAQIIKDVSGFAGEIEIDPRLAEITLGDWDGMTGEEIEAAYPGQREGMEYWQWWFVAPRGESYEAMQARLSSWLEEALESDRPMIVVSHGAAGKVLRGVYLNLEREEALQLPTPQDAYFHLEGGRIARYDCL